MRGYFSAVFLEQFCRQAGMALTDLASTFDLIAGTSVGGIQALGYAFGQTPVDLQNFFVNDGPWMFSISSLLPGVRAGVLTKIATMVGGGSFYSNAPLMERLDTVFGTRTLQDARTTVLIPSYATDTHTPILFSNVTLPGAVGQTELMKNVALATGSAPLYFPPAMLNGHPYIDGGVVQNNPSALALAMAKALYPQSSKFCVLSVGTGLGDIGFHEATFRSQTHALALGQGQPFEPSVHHFWQNYGLGAFENMVLLMSLIGIGITAPQEAAHKQLDWQSTLGLENLYYYRFNTQLDNSRDIELDNSSSEFLTYLKTTALDRISDDAVNLSRFLGHFAT